MPTLCDVKYPLRMLLVWLRTLRLRAVPIGGVSRIPLRVALKDLDVMRHMNNGTYLTLQDLGRTDWMLRTGLFRRFQERGWGAVVVAQTITYRSSLHYRERFLLETRLIGADEKAVFMEQRFTVDGQIRARSFVRARFVKRESGTVTMAELREAVPEIETLDLRLPAWIEPWAAATALPPSKADAPSVWTGPGAE